MLKILSLLFFLVSPISFADQVNTVAGPSLNGGTNPKFGKLGYEHSFNESFSLTLSGSAFFEPEIIGAVSLVASVKAVTASGLFVRIGVGPGAVTRTDDRLSSIPEFNIVYAVGASNLTDTIEAGIEGEHWSNASLFGGPNLGRDFAGFFLGFHL